MTAANEADYRKKYPLVMTYLEKNLHKDIMGSDKIVNSLTSLRPDAKYPKRYVNFVTKWNSGPNLVFEKNIGFPFNAKGEFVPLTGTIKIDEDYVAHVESVLGSNASDDEKLVALFRMFATIIHETGHRMDYPDAIIKTDGEKVELNINSSLTKMKGGDDIEVGDLTEDKIWGYDDNTNAFKTKFNPTFGDDKYNKGVTEGIIENAKKTPEGRKTLPTLPKKN